MKKSTLISCALVFMVLQAHAYIPLNEFSGASVLLNGPDWKFKLNVNGICVISDKNTVSLEQTEEGIVFSHILLSAGKGNKTSFQISLKTYKASEIESVKGNFRIYPVDGNHWPGFLQDLFTRN